MEYTEIILGVVVYGTCRENTQCDDTHRVNTWCNAYVPINTQCDDTCRLSMYLNSIPTSLINVCEKMVLL